MRGPCSCIREKGTWMETLKQMSDMKNVSVLDSPPKPMDWYSAGIKREQVSQAQLDISCFGAL